MYSPVRSNTIADLTTNRPGVMWRRFVTGLNNPNMQLNYTHVGGHKSSQGASEGRARGLPNPKMPQHEVH